MAFPYSEGNLKLELLLSEPGRVESQFSRINRQHEEYPSLRSVVSYAIKLQIAGTCEYNKESGFLLVVSSQMTNRIVHQIIEFIRDELMRSVDIFNLSVGGSFENSATGKSVLEDYHGEGVIICPNMFPFFRRGYISAFNLLDPCLVGRVARAGTNFLLVGPNQNLQMASTGASMLAPITESPHVSMPELPETATQPAASLKELSTKLYESGAPQLGPQVPKHEFSSQKALFKNHDSKLASDAKSAAQKMNSMFPLRRFTVHTSVDRQFASTKVFLLRPKSPTACKIWTQIPKA